MDDYFHERNWPHHMRLLHGPFDGFVLCTESGTLQIHTEWDGTLIPQEVLRSTYLLPCYAEVLPPSAEQGFQVGVWSNPDPSNGGVARLWGRYACTERHPDAPFRYQYEHQA